MKNKKHGSNPDDNDRIQFFESGKGLVQSDAKGWNHYIYKDLNGKLMNISQQSGKFTVTSPLIR
jgi:hypothetical protein